MQAAARQKPNSKEKQGNTAKPHLPQNRVKPGLTASHLWRTCAPPLSRARHHVKQARA
jgi:hypothetical protein